jgi:hypothetical protein
MLLITSPSLKNTKMYLPTILIFLIFSVSASEILCQQAGTDSHSGVDDVSLESLCSYRHVDLTRQSQLYALNGQSARSGLLGVCPEEVISMVTEFNKLVQNGQTNICTLDMAQSFKKFYVTHLDKSKDKSKKAPKSMKKFVFAYGMRMSNLCKKNMLDVITKDGNDLIKEEDVARLGMWVTEEGPLRQLLDKMNQPGEIFLPSDLAAVMSRHDSTTVETMYIQSKATRTIRRLKETCQKRFQPIYEPLILPLTVLAEIGFDFADAETKADFEIPEKHAVMSKWTNILFLCEALKAVEPVDVQETDGESGDAMDKKDTIRLLTKDEAESINQELKSNHKLGYLLDRAPGDLETVVYTPDYEVRMDDLILNKTDSKLMKSINNFKNNKSHMDRVKGRLVRGSLLSARSMIKKGKITVVATAAAKAAWHRLTTRKKDTTEGEVNKALVKTIEEMADTAIEGDLKTSKRRVAFNVLGLIIALGLLALAGWATVSIVASIFGIAVSVLSFTG